MGLGFRILGLRFRVYVGFKVWGLGMRFSVNDEFKEREKSSIQEVWETKHHKLPS